SLAFLSVRRILLFFVLSLDCDPLALETKATPVEESTGWKDKFILDAEGKPTTATHQVFETYQNVEQEIRNQLNAEAEAVQIILTGIDNDIYSIVDACPNACEMWKAIERLKQARMAEDNSPRIHRNAGYESQRSGNVIGARETVESEDMKYDCEQIDQNDEDANLAEERELLASLIEKLKCEIDETKNRNTLLETSNKVLVEKLKSELEDFRNKYKSLTEANNKLSEENDMLYANFKKSKAELKRRNSIEYAMEMELECAKVKGEFYTYKKESQMSCVKHTQTINDLNQTISEMKNKLSAHQDTISVLKQQKDAQIKLYKSREDKEIEKVIDLENKVKILDNFVYKTDQTVQTMNMLNNKCRTSFVKLEYLKKAKQANPRLYDIGCYNDNLAVILSPESNEVIRLEKESRSKLSDLIRPFDYAKLNSLYDLFVPQREKSSEQRFFQKDQDEIADFKNKNKGLTEANNKLSEENDLLFSDYKKLKAELKRRDSIEYALEMELECAKVRGDLLSYKMEYERSSNKYTKTINDLNQTISELKDKLSAHQDTISILKQQKDAQNKLYKTREDKEIEKVID
nr:hypothetical protein [Tanacetum cinerariifolium]